jgi:DNA-binding XRE family transcriptional regulator
MQKTTAFEMDLSPIKALRLRSHLSRRELAAFVGVQWTTIWRWETRGVIPSARDLIALARAFEEPVYNLYTIRDLP